MAWTSPRPNAWYICLAVSMFCSALMVVILPFPNPDQAQKAATAAGSPTNCSMARTRPSSTVTSTICGPSIVRPSGRLALSRTGGDVTPAVGQDRLRLDVQRARGEQRDSVR